MEGLRNTAILTVFSFLAAFVIGVVIAAFRVSPVPPLRVAGAVWVETLRNTSLAVLFLLAFFGLPKAGLLYSPLVSGLIVLSLYTSTYVAPTATAAECLAARRRRSWPRTIQLLRVEADGADVVSAAAGFVALQQVGQ